MVRQLAEEFYPDARKIILVSDNLHTHAVSSLYEAFPAHIAFAIAERLEMHHTPPHGSRLNMAETELSALSMQLQCVGKKRTDNLEDLNLMLAAWEKDRNSKQVGINWQFTTQDARTKLKRLYPEPAFNH